MSRYGSLLSFSSHGKLCMESCSGVSVQVTARISALIVLIKVTANHIIDYTAIT